MKRSRITVALALATIFYAAAPFQRATHADAGSGGAACALSQTGCLKSMVLAEAIPSVIVAPTSAPVTLEVPLNLFITAPTATSCGMECADGNYPISAEISAALHSSWQPVLWPSITFAAISAQRSIVAQPETPAITLGFNPYTIAMTIPAGTPAGIYSVTGTATVSFADGMTLTATSDQSVCLAEEAAGQPGKPRLDVQLLSEQFPHCAPGDQCIARYKITNNDPEKSVTLTAIAGSKQIALRPNGGNESQGVYSIANAFGDDFPITLDSTDCLALPNRPYAQKEIRGQVRKIRPGRSRTVEVAIRPYGTSATGSCSESSLRVEGSFKGGPAARGCAAMAAYVDTAVKSQSCGSSVNDCNRNGVPDADDISRGTSKDRNFNGTPDECEEGAPIITQQVEVSPSFVEPSQPIHVKVVAQDDRAVTSVWANGVSLSSTDGKVWEGDIPSSSDAGPQTVFAMAEDAEHKFATHIGVYETRHDASDFRIEAETTPKTVSPGSTAEFRVRVIGLPSKGVNLSVDGTPPAASASLSATTMIPTSEGAENRLTVATNETTPEGTYTLSVRGSNGRFTREASVILIVRRTVESFDFTLRAFGTPQTISPGGSAEFTIEAILQGGAPEPVNLSAERLPAGASAAFLMNPLIPGTGDRAILTISTTSAVSLGNHSMTIVGRAGVLRREVPVTLTIQVAPPPFSFQLFANSFASVLPGGLTEFKLVVFLNSGIPEPVNLSVEGLPPGATGSFFPNPVTPVGSGTQVSLMISTFPTIAPGTYSLTIVGTSGALRREAQVTLHVQGSEPWDFELQSSESRVVMSCDPRFDCEAHVDITATLLSGPAQPVILSVQGLPQEEFDISVFPNPVTPTAGGARTTLGIFASPVPGTRRVTVVATSGTLTRMVSFDLIIQ